MFNAVAGGYIFRSKVFDLPEAATYPLKLYSVFTGSAMIKNTAFNSFIDFIYDDILSMSRVD